MNINELQKISHENSLAHGFWVKEFNMGEKLALIHSEMSEALEEWRSGHYLKLIRLSENGKPEGFSIELADAIIRIADLAEYLGIDLETCLELKIQYNKTRPYQHGGKLA